jgi:hypothetical protein
VPKRRRSMETTKVAEDELPDADAEIFSSSQRDPDFATAIASPPSGRKGARGGRKGGKAPPEKARRSPCLEQGPVSQPAQDGDGREDGRAARTVKSPGHDTPRPVTLPTSEKASDT